jgi:hypothetical protein
MRRPHLNSPTTPSVRQIWPSTPLTVMSLVPRV